MPHVVVHENPVWRDRANFIIAASFIDENRARPRRWEQLWAQQTSGDRFKLCCIPFFIYDLALGDEVATETLDGKPYVMTKVVRRSGRYTFRVWFTDPAFREHTIEELHSLSGLTEQRWPASNLVAVDASTSKIATAVADLLFKKERNGHLTYETGRLNRVLVE